MECTSGGRMLGPGKTRRVIAGGSFVVFTFAGCFSPETTLNPSVEPIENISSEKIYYVVLRDSTRYDFVEPASVVNDTIVGEARAPAAESTATRQLMIPLTDVSLICVRRISFIENAGLSFVALEAISLTIVVLVYIFSLGTWKPD